MDTKAAIMLLLGAWGVGTCLAIPATAQEAAEANALTDRVWVLEDDDPNRPGAKQIFLSDGTLVSDSCWETYRLSEWQQISETEISWEEDGITIAADIKALSDSELILSLKLGNDVVEQRYAPAQVPYTCPDMVK